MSSIFGSHEPILISVRGLPLPLAGDKVRAGFPSPAEDFSVKRIDLTKVLVTHPGANLLRRVRSWGSTRNGIEQLGP